ncbi:MAG: NAD(P)H-dependent glycerol-3-phosphate dehydrogenase [Candidatus Ancaeobacter aquaticus]|nr:NAD(P)H-dependent glycerol-3-phosphate dehydrogenase [Candidatus Ancaeobacter aquaticus]
MKIAVIGDGGWGTTLGVHLAKKGNEVTIWGPFPEYIALLNQTHVNSKFLPGIDIPETVIFGADLIQMVSDSEVVIVAVPSHYVRSVVSQLKDIDCTKQLFITVSKGIENDTLKRMSEIVSEEVSPLRLAALSGPSHAEEVARGIPTSVTIASKNEDDARGAQELFNSNTFRVYTNTDIVGVELGGALKNVVAIAAGISDGLGFGDNAKAALMTRGIAEMMRLGVALGGQAKTFSGLSGIGDLITTCMSRHSRNRAFGEMIGKGMSVDEALNTTEMVVEGYRTTKSVQQICTSSGVEMPISQQVYNVLYEKKKPLKAVEELMMRNLKAEH